MTELSLNSSDVAGFFDKVPAHGVAGVVGGVAPYPSQITNLIPHRVYHPGIEAAVAVGVGGWGMKQGNAGKCQARLNYWESDLPSGSGCGTLFAGV